jgi:aspartate aminotransferase-like enzyme
MAQPILHHRTPAFEAIFARVRQRLRWLFQTQNEVICMCGTGTLAMEASVVNFMSPGQCALYVDGGKFGERWGEILSAYGCRAIPIKLAWGQAVHPDAVAQALAAHPDAQAVYMQACETSTGVMHPVEAVAELCRSRPNTLCVVDAITALGVFDVAQDKLGLDVVISGSQKAMMLPPGLSFVGVSDKAWARYAQARCPRFYLDLGRERDAMQLNQSAWTSAVSLIVGLDQSLQLLEAEGLEAVFARHRRLSAACQAGVIAMGCRLFAQSPAAGLTALTPPEGLMADAIIKRLQSGYNLTVVGGQDVAKGKIIRLAHMGYFDELDMLTLLGALGCVFAELGRAELGPRGQAAAQAVLTRKS